jgi:hypothetical protein
MRGPPPPAPKRTTPPLYGSFRGSSTLSEARSSSVPEAVQEENVYGFNEAEVPPEPPVEENVYGDASDAIASTTASQTNTAVVALHPGMAPPEPVAPEPSTASTTPGEAYYGEPVRERPKPAPRVSRLSALSVVSLASNEYASPATIPGQPGPVTTTGTTSAPENSVQQALAAASAAGAAGSASAPMPRPRPVPRPRSMQPA